MAKLLENQIVLYTPELEKDDLIFRVNENNFNSSYRTYYKDNIPSNDNKYDLFTHKVYTFTNMEENVYSQFDNNLVIPVAKDNNSFHSSVYNEIKEIRKQELEEIEKSISGSVPKPYVKTKTLDEIVKGVYIVEYFYIRADKSACNELIRYYQETFLTELGDLDNMSTRSVISKINDAVANSKTFAIRTITFISKTDLQKYGAVYSKKGNIVLHYGGIDRNVSHPNSEHNKVNNAFLESKPSCISIAINNPDDIENSYWIKIGNKAHKVLVSKDKTKEASATISIVDRDGVASERYSASIPEMDTKLGIYRTKELAESDGKLDYIKEEYNRKIEEERKAFELKKLEIEQELLLSKTALAKQAHDFDKEKMSLEEKYTREKHIYSMEKINLEKELSNTQIDLAKLKSEKETQIQLLGMEKIKLEQDLLNVKIESEKELIKLKENYENMKFKNDTLTQKLKVKNDALVYTIKLNMSLLELKKLDREYNKNDILNDIKNSIDIVSNIINSGTKILNLFK